MHQVKAFNITLGQTAVHSNSCLGYNCITINFVLSIGAFLYYYSPGQVPDRNGGGLTIPVPRGE